MMTMKIEELNVLFPDMILPLTFPKPFPEGIEDPAKIRAIVLGCDPSNFSLKDGTTNELEFVFGIEGIGKDKRYFSGILKNLNALGIEKHEMFVQNLCRNYFKQVTNGNPDWAKVAKVWIPGLKKELHDLKISSTTPVFLTALELYKVLLIDKRKPYPLKDLYKNPDLVPIKAEDNLLERPLIPLFRGGGNYYSLTSDKNKDFTTRIKNLLQ